MLALAVGLMVGSAGPARGQPDSSSPAAPAATAPGDAAPSAAAPPAAASPPAPSGDALSPRRLLDGPSLHETGRIAVAPSPMPMGAIDNDTAVSAPSPKEKSISRAASSIDTPPAPRPTGFIDQRVLDREIGEHFQEIAGCRVEVARAKQLMPAQIIADKLLLRWIIQPDGSIGQTDVVAIAPIDMGIMDCAKRVMSQWTFTRPRGGPMTVERRYAFQ